MLKSMTAYACAEIAEKDLTVTVEMRSYNSRHLDIALKISNAYAALEEKIKAAIAACVARGRVEVRVKVLDVAEGTCVFEADRARARAYFVTAMALKEALGLPGDLRLEHLVALPGMIQAVDNRAAAQSHWPLMERCLLEALDILDRMRCEEGRHIHQDFADRLEWIATQLDAIETAAEGLMAVYREKLHSRIQALTQGMVALDPGRIAQEAALLADRSDISEEIVRARSHIAQFQATMGNGEPAGRKLNFLLQEFNREFNTMGSKVTQASLAHIIVAVKAELEKLREQVQNIE